MARERYPRRIACRRAVTLKHKSGSSSRTPACAIYGFAMSHVMPVFNDKEPGWTAPPPDASLVAISRADAGRTGIHVEDAILVIPS